MAVSLTRAQHLAFVIRGSWILFVVSIVVIELNIPYYMVHA